MVSAETLNLRSQLKDVYRDYRNVAMSRKYYECRRQTRHNFNVWYEIVLAFGTSGTVGGWALWTNPTGQQIWIGIGILVSIGAIAKPILKLGDDIERLTTLSAKYAALQIDFEQLIFDIKGEQKITKLIRKAYKEICQKLKDIEVKGDSPPDEKLLRKCQEDVNREIPPNSLWWP